MPMTRQTGPPFPHAACYPAGVVLVVDRRPPPSSTQPSSPKPQYQSQSRHRRHRTVSNARSIAQTDLQAEAEEMIPAMERLRLSRSQSAPERSQQGSERGQTSHHPSRASSNRPSVDSSPQVDRKQQPRQRRRRKVENRHQVRPDDGASPTRRSRHGSTNHHRRVTPPTSPSAAIIPKSPERSSPRSSRRPPTVPRSSTSVDASSINVVTPPSSPMPSMQNVFPVPLPYATHYQGAEQTSGLQQIQEQEHQSPHSVLQYPSWSRKRPTSSMATTPPAIYSGKDAGAAAFGTSTHHQKGPSSPKHKRSRSLNRYIPSWLRGNSRGSPPSTLFQHTSQLQQQQQQQHPQQSHQLLYLPPSRPRLYSTP